MMKNRPNGARDFQDDLLSHLIGGPQAITVYLRNRMAVRGRLLELDPYVLLIDPLDGTPPQMVYKSAVVSISVPPRRRPGGPPRPGPRRSGDAPQFRRVGPGGPPDRGYDRPRSPEDRPRPYEDRPRAPQPPESVD